MAFITLDSEKLKFNFNYINSLFVSKNIEWSVVTKMLCGNRLFLEELLKMDIKQVCDSRVSNLKMLKAINPNIETIYLKPPAKQSISSIVKYADVSVNTEFETIRLLSDEARKQQKIHGVIIMIELGELREGVMGDNLIEFYENIFNLDNINVIGIGSNLSCLYGILPNQDKLIQLSLYKQLIEALFDRKIRYVSGGTSVTIPLLFNNVLPKGINHFRVGETLYLGTDVYNDSHITDLNDDIFKFYAEIIELIEKPSIPFGEFGTNLEGKTSEFDQGQSSMLSYRAIIDIGLLDVDINNIKPIDDSINFAGASSDMIVIDLKNNEKQYKVGDLIAFKLNYMSTLRIMNSRYIEKRVINTQKKELPTLLAGAPLESRYATNEET
jgi:ornithine racemase